MMVTLRRAIFSHDPDPPCSPFETPPLSWINQVQLSWTLKSRPLVHTHSLWEVSRALPLGALDVSRSVFECQGPRDPPCGSAHSLKMLDGITGPFLFFSRWLFHECSLLFKLHGFPPLFCCAMYGLFCFGELALICLPPQHFSHCEFSSSL